MEGKRADLYAGAFDVFGRVVLDIMLNLMKQEIISRGKEIAPAMIHNMLNPGNSISVSGKKMLADEMSQFRIYHEHSEIRNSVDALEDSIQYLELYDALPDKVRKKISTARYFKYHSEKWLMESYILSERVGVFLTRIGRVYRRNTRLLSRLEQLKRNFGVMMVGVRNARSKHTHESRFTYDDVERIQNIEALKHGMPDVVKRLFNPDMASAKAKDRFISELKNNIAEIKRGLDCSFYSINQEIIKDGKLLRP